MPFVSVLAVGQAKIVPRELVEEQGEAFGSQPVGTGPFRFVRWERGKEIVLAANPDYFDGPPKLARLVFRIFPGQGVDRLFAEFQAGALEDSPLPAQGLPPDHREPGVPVRSPADLRAPPLRLQHAHEAARRPAGAAGHRPRDRPGGGGVGHLARPIRVREGHPAARDPRLQSEAPGVLLRSRAGARAPGPGGLPRRARAAAHRDLVERPLRGDGPRARADREGSGGRGHHGRASSTTPTGRASLAPCPSGSSRSTSAPGSPTFPTRRTSS